MWVLEQDIGSMASMLDAIKEAGLVGALCWVVWALMTRRLITRGELDDTRAERDAWKEQALRSAGMNERSIDLLHRGA